MAFAAWVLRAFVWRALSAFFSLRPIQARVSRRITFARRGPGKSSASCQEVREPALRHQRWRRSAPRHPPPQARPMACFHRTHARIPTRPCSVGAPTLWASSSRQKRAMCMSSESRFIAWQPHGTPETCPPRTSMPCFALCIPCIVPTASFCVHCKRLAPIHRPPKASVIY